MNNRSDMTDFEKQMQTVLRDSESQLDTQTIRSLANARSEAMNESKKSYSSRFFMPVTGMALASVIALVLVLSPDFYSNQTPALDNEELLLSEGMDLYEDMDFYYWLASEENNLNG